VKRARKHNISITHSKISGDKFTPNRILFKKIVSFLLNLMCAESTEVAIRFCDIDEMKKMNFQFRSKQKPTDVLSFIPDRTINSNHNFLGDILICVPVCRAQALEAKHSLEDELIKMLTHALVHLKGFDHERSDAAERVMSSLEKSLALELEKL